MKRRLTALMIFAALLLSQTAACGDPADPSSGDEGTTEAVTTSEFTKAEVNLSGKTFTLAENQAWSGWLASVMVEEQNGDVLNDAIYQRNRSLEEMYGIDFVGYDFKASGTDVSSLTKTIEAGDHLFDAAIVTGTLMPNFLNRPDFMIPLSKISTIDLSHSWWDGESVKTMTYGGVTPTATGDMALCTPGGMTLIFFNKTIADEYKLDMYQTVRDGKFTFDKMVEISKNVAADLNGNGEADANEDRFGVSVEMMNALNLLLVSGERCAVSDGKGGLKLSLGSERSTDVLEAFVELVDDKVSCVFVQDNRLDNGPFGLFDDGRSLFFTTNIKRASDMRTAQVEFGMLPFPKWEESDEYVTPVTDGISAWVVVPSTNPNADETGYFLEALGYLSKEHTTPGIIEYAVTAKTLRDDESAEMLEIVMANTAYDLGSFYDWGSSMFMRLAQEHNANLASAIESNRSAIEEKIAAFLELYGK